MAGLLASIPVWLWLVWVVLVFLTSILLAPRLLRSPAVSKKRLLRIGGQVLLGAAMLLVRADTVLLSTLLAAIGGAMFGNASGSARSDDTR